MPTVFSHALAAGALSRTAGHDASLRLTVVAALCAVAPDLDVVSFALGIPYEAPFGHRGASHSLVAAAALASVLTPLLFRRAARPGVVWAVLFLATASHGLLDMLTSGGEGVAVAWPLTAERFFFPVRPIRVSPIGADFFSARGLATVWSEALWIGLPSAALLALTAWRRRARSQTAAQPKHATAERAR